MARPKTFKESFRPKSFTHYFDCSNLIQIKDRGTFQVYKRGTDGITILLLHTIGSCALTWALFTKEIAALTNCTVLAIDLRHHGNSVAIEKSNYSLEAFTEDVYDVLSFMYSKEMPQMHIIGHRLGGAIGLKLSTMLHEILSMTLLDATESNCLKAMPFLKEIIERRPKSFTNIEAAILEYVKEKVTTNITAARVVVPGLLYNTLTSRSAADEVAGTMVSTKSLSDMEKTAVNLLLKDNNLPMASESKLFQGNYVWITDFFASERYWHQWYNGMSENFISCTGRKLLILSEDSDLDNILRKGKLQGKFQCDILPKADLMVHETRPADVAQIFYAFIENAKATTKGK